MRLFLLVLLIHSTCCFSQSDTAKKVKFIYMTNFGILNPDFTFQEYISNSNVYSEFKVTPKLGYNTSILAGISSNIFKSCNLENVFGIGYSKNNYSKNGIRISNIGIAGPDTFIGIINESNLESNLILMNGLSFYNPDKKNNKLYFSNYITVLLNFNKVFYTESIDDIKNTKGKSKIHTKYLNFMFNSTHLVSYSIKFNSNEFKIGVGCNIYFFKYQRGYINPLINLTLTI